MRLFCIFCLCVSVVLADRGSAPGRNKPSDGCTLTDSNRVRNCVDDNYGISWEYCDEKSRGKKEPACTDETDWVLINETDSCFSLSTYIDYKCIDSNTVESCSVNCPLDTKCNDGDASITCISAICGDAICELDETCISCELDCGQCLNFCGDGFCGILEECSNCPEDCGACSVSCSSTLAERLTTIHIPLTHTFVSIFTDVTEVGNIVVVGRASSIDAEVIMSFDEFGVRRHDDIVIEGATGIMGFEVSEDYYALLLLRPNTHPNANSSSSLYFYRVSPDGTVLADSLLMGECDPFECRHPSANTGSLVTNGVDYFAYHGLNNGSSHQGDTFQRISSNGMILEVFWSWGLSHSGTQRVIRTYEGGIETFGVSDCFPSNGIFQGRRRVLSVDSPSCGNFYYWLGNVVAMPDGYWVSFVHTDWLGVHGTGVLRTDLSGLSSSVSWIDFPERTPGLSQLVPFEGNLLMAYRRDWNASNDPHTFVRIDALTGQQLGVKEDLAVIFSHHGIMRITPSGDAVWAGVYSQDTVLNLFRLSACFND